MQHEASEDTPMADEQRNGLAWLPLNNAGLAGLLALLTVLGLVLNKPALESRRPGVETGAAATPLQPPALLVQYARLWEDPFRREINGPPATQEAVNAYVGKLFKREGVEWKPLLCLPVIVPGGPFEDDRELRTRACYAVAAALASCGYQVDQSDRMTYLQLGGVRVVVPATGESKDQDITVPLQVFTRSSAQGPNAARVLVLWINEDDLGEKPLNVLGQVLDRIFPACTSSTAWTRNDVELGILSFVGSDGYRLQLREVSSEAPGLPGRFGNRRPELYVVRATVRTKPLSGGKEATEEPRIIRTVGDDGMLAELLVKELDLRGALGGRRDMIVLVTESDTLYGQSFPQSFEDALRHCSPSKTRAVNRPRLQVVRYLRGLDGRSAERGGVAGKTDEEKKGKKEAGSSPAEGAHGPAQLDYLRRLEEQLVQVRSRTGMAGGRVTAVGVVGTDVYDKLLVLRALRKRLPDAVYFTTDLDARLWDPQELACTRNLVVATHFGLTLREPLPERGGSCWPFLESVVPPFRDSYQTALYFSCRLALRDPKLPDGLRDPGKPWAGYQGCLSPLVYEIGRGQPYQLTIPGEKPGDAKLHPASPREAVRTRPGPGWDGWRFWAGLALWFLSGALLMGAAEWAGRGGACGESGSPAWAARSLCWWRAVLPVLALLWLGTWLLKAGTDLGQFSWLFVGVLAGLGSGAILVWTWSLPVRTLFIAVRQPEDGRYHAWLRAVLALGAGAGGVLALVIIRDHGSSDGEPFSLVLGISIWPSVVLRFAALILGLLLIVSCFREKQKACEKARRMMPRTSRSQDSQRAGSLREKVKDGLNWGLDVKADEPASDDKPLPYPSLLYERYALQSAGPRCLLRSLVLAGLYCAFCLCVLAVFGWPNNPTRGAVSYWANWLVLAASLVVLFTLLFLVKDASKLCRSLVEKLAGGPADGEEWCAEGRHGLERGKDYPPRLATEVLTIRLIAEETHVVNGLIYYPFVLIFMLVLSRYPGLEGFAFSWPLTAVIGLGLAIALSNAVMLRRAAERARKEVLRRLENERAACLNAPPPGSGPASEDKAQGGKAEQYRLAIAEIQAEQGGAFCPISSDPLLGAPLIPFGGMGLLVLVEHLVTSL